MPRNIYIHPKPCSCCPKAVICRIPCRACPPRWPVMYPRAPVPKCCRLLHAWCLPEETAFLCEHKIGRAHVCTPVTNAHLVCRLLLETQYQSLYSSVYNNTINHHSSH